MSGGARMTLLALWAGLVWMAGVTHGYFPVDETRYLGVAWEMWVRGDFLVPYHNGLPYDHKPPLLFWLIHAGWWLFGVNAWWPRCVPALAALANLALTTALARRLWPKRPVAATLVPWILMGGWYWALTTTWLLFDMLMTGAVLLAVIGLVMSARDHDRRGFLLTGLALGLGALAKGPVVLVYVLPIALTAPWWSGVRGAGWYRGIALAVFVGLCLACAWVIPAALAGGPDYAAHLLWGQTTGRLAGAEVPHARPWWWYWALLPALALPWALWPPAWRALRQLRSGVGVRLGAVWLLAPLLLFSLISGKQAHYLLPILPAAALLLARAGAETTDLKPGYRWPAYAIGLLGCALIGVVMQRDALQLPAGWHRVSPLAGLAVLAWALVCGVALRRGASITTAVRTLAWCSFGLIVIVHLGVVRAAWPAYDLRPISRLLAGVQHQGRPIAYRGNYHGQFHFLGRLTQPIAEVEWAAVPQWLAAHPDGYLVAYHAHSDIPALHQAAFVQAYRGRAFALWRAATLLQHPELQVH